MSDYLAFVLIHDTGKTKIIGVDSARHGNRLATIRWYGAWRQYTLHPEVDTIWNNECLQEVATYLEELMAGRKAASRSKMEART